MQLAVLLRETPHTAAAMLGLGLAVFVRESSAMTSIYTMIGPDVAQYGFFSAALIAAVMAWLYAAKPKLRLSRHASVSAVAAVVTSVSLFFTFAEALGDAPALRTVLFSAYQIGAIVIIVSWCETLVHLGSVRVGLVFVGAVAVYVACNATTIVLRQDVASILTSLFPIASAGLLAFYQKTPLSESQTSAQNHLVPALGDHRRKRAAIAVLGIVIMSTIFCSRFAFGYVNGEWMPLQDAASISMFGQVSNLIGTALAGLLMLSLLAKCWNQSTLIVMEMATLVSLVLCLYLAQSSPAYFAQFGLIPLAFGQKLIMLIILLSPFLVDAKNPPLVLCAAYALTMAALGTFSCTSLLVPAPHLHTIVMVALGTFIVLAFSLFFLLNGNHTESESNVAHRLGQSAFNENERLPLEDLPPAVMACCLAIAKMGGLTQRETEVLLLLANRYNAGSIADMLVISEATAKTHMRKIYAKLNVHSQKELIRLIQAARRPRSDNRAASPRRAQPGRSALAANARRA